jgi:hypothetical protein
VTRVTALRAAWLTWKLHRFEVAAVLGVAALLAATLWILTSHLRAVEVGPGCWDEWPAMGSELNDCQLAVDRWLDVNEHEAGRMTGIMSYLPVLLGVVLGVPIVARETELRTIGLAWSLQGRRWRWLLARSLPMVGIAMCGALSLALASSEMRSAQAASPFETGDIDDIARQGPVVAARLLLGLGVGLFTGALLGRTLPALLVAGLLGIGWVGIVGPMVEREEALRHATWVADTEVEWAGPGRGPAPPLAWLDQGYRGRDGVIVRGSLWDDLCDPDANECPAADDYEYLGYVTPLDAWDEVERAELAATMVVAMGAAGATFGLVSRRRPD